MPAGTIIMNGNIHQYQGGNIGSESDRDEDNIVGEDGNEDLIISLAS